MERQRLSMVCPEPLSAGPGDQWARDPRRVERLLPRPELRPGTRLTGHMTTQHSAQSTASAFTDLGVVSRPRTLMPQASAFTLLSSTRQTREKPLTPIEQFSRFFGMATVFELGKEPGAGVSPMTLGGCQRDLEHLGDLGHGQAGEEAELDQLGLRQVFLRELVEGLVEGFQVYGWCLRHVATGPGQSRQHQSGADGGTGSSPEKVSRVWHANVVLFRRLPFVFREVDRLGIVCQGVVTHRPA
jgi:hypothetical protein